GEVAGRIAGVAAGAGRRVGDAGPLRVGAAGLVAAVEVAVGRIAELRVHLGVALPWRAVLHAGVAHRARAGRVDRQARAVPPQDRVDHGHRRRALDEERVAVPGAVVVRDRDVDERHLGAALVVEAVHVDARAGPPWADVADHQLVLDRGDRTIVDERPAAV